MLSSAVGCTSGSRSSGGGQQIGKQYYKIITQYGDMLVIKQGVQTTHQTQASSSQSSGGAGGGQEQPQRPVIMTFHDLGLNSELQFSTFCECDEVKLMLQTFTMIHVNFIGQEFSTTSNPFERQQVFNQQQASNLQDCNSSSGSSSNNSGTNNLPEDFKYPSVEQLAESIVDICAQMRIRSFIALAVGAGAYIVGSLALMRPDLVDGLFLINPVITSCSITEWLYFKMSAIASNHHIGNWNSSSSSSASTSTSARQEPGPDQEHNHNGADHTSGSPKSHHQSGSSLRKLLSAAHLHLAHHNKEHNQQGPNKQHTVTHGESHETSSMHSETVSVAGSTSTGSGTGRTGEENLDELSTQSSPTNLGPQVSAVSVKPSGSRLRQLIFSKNFRSALNQQSSSSSLMDSRKNTDTHHAGASSGGSNDSLAGSHSERQVSTTGGKRPPFEYLMYHHFGPASFQRYRRSSDTPVLLQQGSGSPVGSCSPRASAATDSSDRANTDEPQVTGGSPASTSSGSVRLASRSTRRGQPRLSQRTGSRSSSESLEAQTVASTANQPPINRGRSGSVCMSSSYLASFSSDRQRHAYMQAVYKQYFGQVNAHNLWLFVQSFAKRKTLNLRKDCGAAAHAAAAAATLGTSICTAFVGLAPSAAGTGGPDRRAGQVQVQVPGTGKEEVGARTCEQVKSGGNSDIERRPVLARRNSLEMRTDRVGNRAFGGGTGMGGGDGLRYGGSLQQQQQVLVAGTKVKRTFTCQTLIMCSSVQMHCERAFKLMSLLNPLQATWIKTDHLLVLEERPEKVCQALRLFLQGIGYSMSTYERRLRLSSATGSASSADSTGSAKSLSGEAETQQASGS